MPVALYTSAWIEIIHKEHQGALVTVALYTSAWIEIWSHIRHIAIRQRRTLHECVD